MTELIILRAHTDFQFPTWSISFFTNFGIYLPKKLIFGERNGTMYSRVDQVKFVEGLNRPYPFKYFKSFHKFYLVHFWMPCPKCFIAIFIPFRIKTIDWSFQEQNLSWFIPQKQPFADVIQNRCSWKFRKKRLQHRSPVKFPVKFVKFLRTTFFIEHFWWLLLILPYSNFLKRVLFAFF